MPRRAIQPRRGRQPEQSPQEKLSDSDIEDRLLKFEADLDGFGTDDEENGQSTDDEDPVEEAPTLSHLRVQRNATLANVTYEELMDDAQSVLGLEDFPEELGVGDVSDAGSEVDNLEIVYAVLNGNLSGGGDEHFPGHSPTDVSAGRALGASGQRGPER